MLVAFTLSMPGVNTWNGKWTGEGKCYAIVKNVGTSKKAIEKYSSLLGSYSYHWEDGWSACIDIIEVDSKEAAKLRKNSRGFCGYEWMVKSIIDCGEIKTGE